MSENYSLKWNDFRTNVTKSFRQHRNEEYLQDVTIISSDDCQSVQAHKLVLSSCSEYFRNILKKTSRQSDTVLCLDGVNSEDVKNILDYAYDGEVMIFQENLDRFLNVAQKLKLEGLLNNVDKEPIEEIIEEVENEHDTQFLNHKNDTIPMSKPIVKTGNNIRTSYQAEEGHCNQSMLDDDEGGSEDSHQQRLQDNIIVHEVGFSCKVCGRDFKTKFNAKRHVEIHLGDLSYNCSQCDKTFKSKNAFISHNFRNHK